MSHPVAVTVCVWIGAPLATTAAVSPSGRVVHPTALAGLETNKDDAAMPVTLSAPTVSHPAPKRRVESMI